MGYPDVGRRPGLVRSAEARRSCPGWPFSCRIILVIPQLIALFFVGIALFVVSIVAFFVVIIAGRWPEGLRDFVVGANRWVLRVDAWFSLLADPYPPFSLT